ncbi:protein PTHB1-like [Uloborus diversus]|uniref:protein PTHB1-like n=1 Tax=Uloborus diversus TaxID=327109 RepID=UPI0024096069|nr:protein PTHB1-like [Uloborus diversus]
MSLFKACDWWSTSCGSDEQFDKGCLVVSNIDNSSEKQDKIITGSHNGVIRVYKPQPVKQEDGNYSSFRPDDLLLEAQVKFPIIQIATGVLALSSGLVQLAVLHPFKLSVYSISAVQGSVEHGIQCKFSLMYEHNLQRHAFSLLVGQFGGIQGKDMMCVQSLDGTLNFFEQERFSFSRFLPKSLIPGPICYINKTDSFVTVNGFTVESYRFQVLASASDESSENENLSFKGKKVTPEWTYDLADPALDMSYVEDKTSPTLVILGERSIAALNSHGSAKFYKKFRFTPRCFYCYKAEPHDFLIVLIVTSNQTLLIYHETQLKWAAQLTFSPMSISRGFFADVKGIITLLSEEGLLSCCYLGTEPSLFVSPLSEPKEIDFKEAEQEMNRLKKIIKSSNQNLLGTQKLGTEISLSISVAHHLNSSDMSENEDDYRRSFGPVPSVPVKIQLKCRTVVHDVRLTVYVESPLRVSQNVFVFGSVLDGSQAVVSVTLGSPFIPTSLKLTAHAAYINSYGAPRIIDASAQLPFNLIARSYPPAKEAETKITIDINKKPLLLTELLPDLMSDGTSYPGGAMGIEYFSGPIVTILPSKTAQRYRLQSDSFPALWLAVSELVRRLQHKYRKEADNAKLKCSYSSSLPLQEYFKVIEEHFTNRQVIQEVEDLIAHRSLQFRVVQKRLLTKLKDSTPTPLNNLDTLLEATHRQIMSVTETMDRHLKALEGSSCALGCATNLILLLLRLSVDLPEDQCRFLSACFSPIVDFDSQQGWEEKVNVAMIYLLKNCLGKGNHETKFPEAQLKIPKDLSKLRKHISLVMDKISKNTPLVISDSYTDVLDEKRVNENEMDEMNLPEGCKYVDNVSPRPSSAAMTNTLEENELNGNMVDTAHNLQDEGYGKTVSDEEEMII